jgi:tetratricopeptide (TPR) repeat protein
LRPEAIDLRSAFEIDVTERRIRQSAMSQQSRQTVKPSRAGRRRSAVAADGRADLPFDWFWPAAIFAIALVFRLIHLWQIESIPLFYELAGDGRTYDEWAQRIAGGDWLGHGVFYQAPLYPYFLGVLQFVLGHDLWRVRFLQVLLGSLSCGLIYWVGQRLFSRPVGIAAGLVLACYAPAIFFDAVIEKSVLDLMLLSLLLFFLCCFSPENHWLKWCAAGAVLGLLGLSRENALILAPVVGFWIWLHFTAEPPKVRIQWLGLFFAGLLVVLFPVGVRNLGVGGEFKLTTSQFGPNFYIGNNPAADGTYGSIRNIIGEPQLEGPDAKRLAERARGRAMTPGEVSSYWLDRSLEYIKAQPAEWLRLIRFKLLLVWNAREIEDSDDFYIYQNWSWLLRFFAWFGHFGTLAPFAAVGVLFTFHQWRRLWLLYAMILSLALSVAAFYVFGRYRFPLVPLLALFAGAGIVEATRACQQHAWRKLGLATILWIGATVVINWPLQKITGAGASGYNNLSNAYYKQGKVEEAIETALKAIELDSGYGVAYYNLGNLYAGQGRFDLARGRFEEALRLLPNYAEAHSNYGQLLAESGDMGAGLKHFEKAVALNPNLGRAQLNLGVALAKQGELEAAIAPLQEAARLNTHMPQASFYLGSVYAAQKHYSETAQAFHEAIRIDGNFAPAHESLSLIYREQGKTKEAIDHAEAALRILKAARPRQRQEDRFSD